MRPCFQFTARAGDKPAVLAIDEEIGFWGTQAVDFRAQLDAVTGNELEVEINSIGGEVFAGLGMYNMLRTWAAREGNKLTTRVTGLAASIASVVALAGDTRQMPKNSFAMVHQASGGAWGTADDMRDAAETLDKIDGAIRGIYVDRMGIDEAKARDIMAKDTWLTAAEAKELGFATDLTDAVEATAKFSLERAALPEHVAAIFKPKAQVQDDKPEDDEDDFVEDPSTASPVAEQISAKVKAAGLESYVAVFAVACTTVADAEARIGRALEIQALCKLAGRADDAVKAIKADTPVADVRKALITAMAEDDKPIDNTPPPKKEAVPGDISPSATWENRNKRKAQSRAKGR